MLSIVHFKKSRASVSPILTNDRQEGLLNHNNQAPLDGASTREEGSQAMDAITNAVIHGRCFAKKEAGYF
jgi:hypothetical protein